MRTRTPQIPKKPSYRQKNKIKIYKMLIKPILTYACETWTLSKSDENLLCTFERKIIRRIFGGINIDDEWRRYNKELYQLYNSHDIVAYIRVQRFRWVGHIQRAPEDYPPKQIVNGRIEGSRLLGRAKLRCSWARRWNRRDQTQKYGYRQEDLDAETGAGTGPRGNIDRDFR